MFAYICTRSAATAALVVILAIPASAVQANSPTVADVACMTRDLPRLRDSRAALSMLCALRSGAGRQNTAQVQQRGANNRAEIHQRGSGHTANLVQQGSNNSQMIFQFGRDTRADIRQTGGQSGVLIQFGW